MYHIKRFLYLILILVLSITIIGCGKSNVSDNVTLTPPENYEMPLSGTWIITKYYATNYSMDNKISKSKIGQEISISKDKIELLDKVCTSPTFKIKTVDSTSYFASNYGISPDALGIKQTDIKIITVTSKDNYFTSFIELNDNNLIASLDDTFFLLSKKTNVKSNNSTKNKSSESDELVKSDSVNISNSMQNRKYFKNFNSGVLLGLKSYSKTPDNIKKPNYRTVWINLGNDSVKNVENLPYLLLPRKNGFWGLKSQFNSNNNLISYNTVIYPIDKVIKENINLKSTEDHLFPNKTYSSIEEILFVANDYISTLNNNYTKYKGNIQCKKSFLSVRPIDTINTNKKYSMSVAKFTGDQGIKSLKQGAATYLTSLDFNERKKLANIPEDNNFGVFRKDGKWILKGRLNNSNKGYVGTYGDFDIPIIPPKELIGYDILYPNWNVIKEKVPEAMDAYSSPDQNFVLVLTKHKILIYNINNTVISNNPLKIISLNNEETVIMSQWATGSYVNSWNDQMKKLIKKIN